MPFEFSPTVSELDIVPEQFRGLYVKPEGAETYTIHPDFTAHVSGLSSALGKERKSAKDYKLALDKWKALGEDPDAVGTQLNEWKEAAAKKGGDTTVNLDKIKGDLAKGWEVKLNEKETQIGAMRKTLDRHLIDAAATAAIVEAKGSPALLLPIIRGSVKVLEENGEYVVRVLDKDGDARGNHNGGLMSIAEFVAELKTSKDYGRAFEASGTTGGGKLPNSSKPNSAGSAGGGERSPQERIAAGLANRKKH